MAFTDIPFRPSTNIKSVAYDPEDQVMEIVFHDGGTYRYHGVSEETAHGFETADSAGGYFHAFVKHQHQFSKLG